MKRIKKSKEVKLVARAAPSIPFSGTKWFSNNRSVRTTTAMSNRGKISIRCDHMRWSKSDDSARKNMPKLNIFRDVRAGRYFAE
jgi:hypothetical protein